MHRKRNISTLSYQHNTKRLTRFQPQYDSIKEGNAQLTKSNPTESAQIVGFGRHTLELAPPNITKLTPQAQNKLLVNPNARLGLDVCMICASKLKPETEVVCTHCGGKVAYCSSEHQKLDRKIHRQVCPYLAMIDEDQRFEEDFPALTSFIWKQLVPLFFDVSEAFRNADEPDSPVSNASTAEEKAAQTLKSAYRCPRVNVNASPRLWQWESLLFASLRARFAKKSNETMEAYREKKSVDTLGTKGEDADELEADSEVKSSIQDDKSDETPKDSKKFVYGDWNAFEAKKSGESWILPQSTVLASTCLRVATASLANPLTIAQTIGTNPALLDLVRRTLATNDNSNASNTEEPTSDAVPTLTLHVIGASEHECLPDRLPFWSALPAALSALLNLPLIAPGNIQEQPKWRVQILFVGLEMPEILFSSPFSRSNLHGLSPHLSFAFFEGMYEDCVELLDAATSERVNMSPPLKLPPCPPTNSNNQGTLPIVAREATGRWSFTTEQENGFALSWGYPTLLCGFQMGLTVPEYSWRRTLQTMNRMAHSSRWNRYSKLEKSLLHSKASEDQKIAEASNNLNTLHKAPSGSPPVERDVFLLTTSSSEEEAILESQIMTRGHRFASIVIAAANPLRSLQPLQSGTLGNDVWSKNVAKSLYQLSTLF